ncbi:pyridoxal phosphate-dependent aminotransferase [Granulicella cerasi]|uniref:alanine transaminase n=1 Tax=Granulicella cerasi TaxID=741063 RepID=A0ABW1Z6K9_9BACT|nr:pyridoxal phosphate-dependent aminotransferase [Granulicella cerasi]
MLHFSDRTAWELEENEFTRRVRARRDAGLPLIDLTRSNPTQCGFNYSDDLLAPLSAAGAAVYEPAAFGMVHARQAVAKYYGELGANVREGAVCLTTSTSEAYSYLFRLLCDPGDEVLIARPSYPLFDYIARLDGVVLREYPLHYDPIAEQWWIDFVALRECMTPRTRAIILVHPNNPTGSYVHGEERRQLEELCVAAGIALIVDEVFLEYAIDASEPSFAVGEAKALTFVLSGLSKVAGLPQMKASWIVTRGPVDHVQQALARLAIIADTFLSMNAPVQFALGAWLANRAQVQNQLRARVHANLTYLRHCLRGTHCNVLAVEGGWTAVLQVPVSSEPSFADMALDAGVLVQPGDFYGMGTARVVLSLLTPEAEWQRGLAQLPLHSFPR